MTNNPLHQEPDMASTTSHTTDHDLIYEAKDGKAADSSSSQDGSHDEEKINQPTCTTKEAQGGNPKHVSNRWVTILEHGARCFILIFGIPIAMLVLVLSFKLDSFEMGNLSSEQYFFLRNTPTSAILCITSLASLLSILLVRSLLKLSSFCVAHDLLVNSVAGNHAGLPSTRNFATVLSLLTGGSHAFVNAVRRSLSKPSFSRGIIRKVTALYAFAVLLRLVVPKILPY